MILTNISGSVNLYGERGGTASLRQDVNGAILPVAAIRGYINRG